MDDLGGALPLRPALSLIALIAVLALAVDLVFGSGGLLDPRPSISPAEAQNLSAPQAPPVHAPASAACLRTYPAVTAVHLRGNAVSFRLTGRSRAMTIRYLANDHAAVRWAYAHNSPNDAYENTIWIHAPATETVRQAVAIGHCLRPTPTLLRRSAP